MRFKNVKMDFCFPLIFASCCKDQISSGRPLYFFVSVAFFRSVADLLVLTLVYVALVSVRYLNNCAPTLSLHHYALFVQVILPRRQGGWGETLAQYFNTMVYC